MRFAFLVLALVGIAALARADEPSPDMPYSAERSNPIEYEIEFAAVVTAPYKTEKLRVWLPIPPSDRGQELLSSEITSFPEEVEPQIGVESTFGNKFAYLEFVRPQGAQIVRHKFRIRVYELRWNLDAERITPLDEWPQSFEPYRRSESQAVVRNDRFDNLLSQLVPQRNNPLRDLGTVMSWVESNFTYDHVDASLQASSLHALEKRRGHCSDYHGFCAAMGRALGQPTRVTYGMNTFPKASPSHCKLEAYLAPYGWVSFDVSETQKLCQAIRDSDRPEGERRQLIAAAQRRLLSGFRDNTWFAQTRGTDYDLQPKASRRVAVVHTIYAEADGQPLPEPDPSSKTETRFSWMTSHRFTPNKKVSYPFSDLESLKGW